MCKKINLFKLICIGLAFLSCAKKEDESLSNSLLAGTKVLYFASGQCNSGTGITTFSSTTASKMVSRVNLTTADVSQVLDFSAQYQGGFFAPETTPQSLVDSGSSLFLLTENSVNMGERKILTIPKSSPYNTSVYSNDALALTQVAAHITRTLSKDVDGALLFSKSVAIEKIGTSSLRIPMGTNPWVSSPAGSCATSNTYISSAQVMPPYTGTSTGKIIFAHQGNSAALNRLAIISNDGYATAGNCLNGYQISTTTHTNAPGITGSLTFAAAGVSPTSMVYVPTPTGTSTGKLIVSYSASVNTELTNATNLNYAIVMWTVNETSSSVATLTSPVVLYRDSSVIFGASAMAYEPESSTLYVAAASQSGTANLTTAGYGYKIEKFALDLNTPSLTRVGTTPFVNRSSATKCISSMIIGTAL